MSGPWFSTQAESRSPASSPESVTSAAPTVMRPPAGVHSEAFSSRLASRRSTCSSSARTGGLALGSRYVEGGSIVGWKWHRLLLSSAANTYCRLVLGLRVRDCTAGYRCYTRALLMAIDLDQVFSQGYIFQVEMLYRCIRLGFPVEEVPIRFEDRIAGVSKVSQGEVRKALLGVLLLRGRLGGRRSNATDTSKTL